MARLWDSVLFNAELDMLECRLVQMEDSPVYRHIVVEADRDHQGHPKPLHYLENKERFAPWADRIIHVVANLPSPEEEPNPFEREGIQREFIRAGLQDADPGDMLILADCDEIPSMEAISKAAAGQRGTMNMTGCMFYADLLWGDPVRTTGVTTVGEALAQGMKATRRDLWCGGTDLTDRGGSGHHLTWMGGDEAVLAKLHSHCHTECEDDVRSVIAGGLHWRVGANPFGRYGYTGPLIRAEIDGSWPHWVAERRCPQNWFRPRED